MAQTRNQLEPNNVGGNNLSPPPASEMVGRSESSTIPQLTDQAQGGRHGYSKAAY